MRVHGRPDRPRLAVDSAVVLLGVVGHGAATLLGARAAAPPLGSCPRRRGGARHRLFDVTVCIWTTTIWHHVLEPHPLLHLVGAHLRGHLTSGLAGGAAHHGRLLAHHWPAGRDLLETLAPGTHGSTRAVHEPHVWATLAHLTHHVWHILTLFGGEKKQ